VLFRRVSLLILSEVLILRLSGVISVSSLDGEPLITHPLFLITNKRYCFILFYIKTVIIVDT
jgi:hypothetical protein